MKIESSAFENDKFIPVKFTCDGEDINPELKFSEIPLETKSLALIVEDPDSPVPNFTHWIIWNIDPKTELIKEIEAPKGAIEGLNDFGKIGYLGPCPNKGIHRYIFNLYALRDRIDLPSGSSKKSLQNAIKDKILASAQLMGIYKRK